jgi:hypothetical protein
MTWQSANTEHSDWQMMNFEKQEHQRKRVGAQQISDEIQTSIDDRLENELNVQKKGVFVFLQLLGHCGHIEQLALQTLVFGTHVCDEILQLLHFFLKFGYITSWSSIGMSNNSPKLSAKSNDTQSNVIEDTCEVTLNILA